MAVENLTNTGSVTGGYKVGGIVGLASGCTISGTKAKDASNVWGEDWNLANYADISGYSDVGGIVGEARQCNISTAFSGNNSSSAINITATSGTVGGIAGSASGSAYSIRDCSIYECDIKAVDSSNVWHNYAGGVLGSGNVNISGCYMDIVVAGYAYVGCIVGSGSGTISSNTIIGGCFANGNTTQGKLENGKNGFTG